MHASKEHIRMPNTEDEIRLVMGLYERNDHPGCIGSVDCVHVIWDKYRSGMQALCTGKEKVPTLVFEAACSHTRRILSVSSWFFGTYNDKTISKYDPVMQQLKEAPFSDIEWIALSKSENGEIVEKKQIGAYFMCDGGYHLWETLIPPYKDQLEGTSMMEWSKHNESSRKDIECVFGINKKRFLFLKHPIRFHDPELIQRAVVTCFVLHNLLLEYDGKDNWEYQLCDDEYDANAAYGTLETLASCNVSKCRKNNRSLESGISRSSYNRNGPGDGIALDTSYHEPDSSAETTSSKILFHKRREILVEHFRIMKNKRVLHSMLR